MKIYWIKYLMSDIEIVIHFAGLKAVGESVSLPLEYYENNFKRDYQLIEINAEKQSA